MFWSVGLDIALKPGILENRGLSFPPKKPGVLPGQGLHLPHQTVSSLSTERGDGRVRLVSAFTCLHSSVLALIFADAS